jgi:hypothetical protein
MTFEPYAPPAAPLQPPRESPPAASTFGRGLAVGLGTWIGAFVAWMVVFFFWQPLGNALQDGSLADRAAVACLLLTPAIAALPAVRYFRTGRPRPALGALVGALAPVLAVVVFFLAALVLRLA